MNFANIPQIMRQYSAWVVWKYEESGGEKPDKVPYCPHSRQHASVSDPSTWGTFHEACELYRQYPNMYAGIGFVFSDNDPFLFIDLDDTKGNKENSKRQQLIYELANSYSERSPSGQGLHIIGLGSVPSGRRRSNIEIYSRARFATFTGDVYNFRNIVDCQELATKLWTDIGKDAGHSFYDPKAPQVHEDEAIYDMACKAENAAKFKDLWAGNWREYEEYKAEGQSAADQALINILAFYTQNREQIVRLFHYSSLGQRKKAKRTDYMEWTINKAFDRILPPVDISGLKEAIDMYLQDKALKAQKEAATDYVTALKSGSREETPLRKVNGHQFRNTIYEEEGSSSIPVYARHRAPGLTGLLADFILAQATLPVPEVAIASALGFMAAICQRAYNISGTGLNQYILLLARTGIGKEAIGSGIDKVVNEIRPFVPGIVNYFGPSSIASGQALERYLTEQNAFLSIVGEVDKMIIQLSSRNSNFAQLELRRKILDLYNKSGYGRMSRGTVYSDTNRNTKDIVAPAFSILGEGTPERLYAALDEDMISEGLLGRFTIIEYSGERVKRNKKAHEVMPPKQLIDGLCQLVDRCVKMDSNNDVMNITLTNEAETMSDEFEEYCRFKINERHQNPQLHLFSDLWARAHIKSFKLAGLLAVGINSSNPIVDTVCLNYAIKSILHDVEQIINKFEQGDIGMKNEELQQLKDAKNAIKLFVMSSYEKIAPYGVTRKQYEDRAIPMTYMMRRLPSIASFRKDRMGATFALKRTMKTLVDEGLLQEISKTQTVHDYKSTGIFYGIKDVGQIVDK